MALLEIGADLGQLGHQAGDGAVGDALDRAEGLVEARPQGIVVDQRGDLALEPARLALEQGDHLVEAGQHLGVVGSGAALLLAR